MTVPLVPINSAPAEQLEALYGVGSRLAERIVRHREQFGPFRGPEELARVEGFGLELAVTLSPHIDWATGEAGEEDDLVPVTRWDWVSALVLLIVWIGIVRWLTGGETFRARTAPLAGFPRVDFLPALAAVLFVTSLGFFNVGLVAWVVESVLPWRSRRRVADRLAIWAGALGVVLGAISLVLALSLGGTTIYGPGLTFAVASALLFWPQFLVLHNPALATSRKLAMAHDLAWIVVIPASAFMIATFPEETPLLIDVLFGLIGLMGVFLGVQALRGQSDFLNDVRGFVQDGASRPQPAWMTWLNTRVPSQQDQRALQAALNRTYPPSRLRSLGGAIVVGAGGWLVITALGAIVEWLIQNWLDGLV